MILFIGFTSCHNCKNTDKITCYSPAIEAYKRSWGETNDFYEKYCPDDDKAYVPCDCYIDAGYTQPFSSSDYDKFHDDVVPRCEYYTLQNGTPNPVTYCTYSGGCPGSTTSPISIQVPYVVINGQLNYSDNQIFAQYSTYYFDDDQILSLDKASRPVYFEFYISNIDYNTDKLQFKITYSSGTLISEVEINPQDNNSYKNSLRRWAVCTGYPCATGVMGTIKMDMKDAFTKLTSFAGTYTISMYKNNSILFSSFFTVVTSQDNSTHRLFELKTFKSTNLNFINYLYEDNDAPKSFADGLAYVFGNGKSNISFVAINSSITLGSTLIDADEDALLNYSLFNYNSNTGLWEVEKGFYEWFKKLYDNNGITNTDLAIIVEVQAMKRWDFDNNQLASDNSTFNDWFNSGDGYYFTGNTVTKDPSNTFGTHPGCVAFRRNINKIYNDDKLNLYSSKITVNGMVLTTLYHEIGHVWAEYNLAGNGSDDCPYHTSYCTGINVNRCLWHYCSAANPIVTVFKTYIKFTCIAPTFCEAHQQIFMNQLLRKD